MRGAFKKGEIAMIRSNFEKWFKLQFGQLPMATDIKQKMKQDCEASEYRAANLRLALRKDDVILAQWTAAHYSKNAAPSGFTF